MKLHLTHPSRPYTNYLVLGSPDFIIKYLNKYCSNLMKNKQNIKYKSKKYTIKYRRLIKQH